MGSHQAAAHRGWLLAVLMTMLFMYQADAAIVNVATPAIRTDLGASGAQLELVISGYLLASASLIVIGARLGYLYGCRPVFLTGLGVFGAASLACGLAPSPTVLIAARVLQGVGGALAYPQVLTGIQVYFREGAVRARALSLYSVALAGGAVAGQILGGLLVSADLLGLGWRPVFLINVPVTLAALLAGARFLPRDGAIDGSRRLDVPGAVTLSAAMLLIIVPLTLGRQAGWPAWAWACLAASLPVVWSFGMIEQRRTASGRSPLINLRVIRRRPIVWGLLSQALAVATYFALLFTLAAYLQRGLGRSAFVSGLTLLPWVVAFALPGRLQGQLPGRWRPLLPLAGCLSLATAYGAIAVSMFTGERPAALLLGLLALGGLGLGTNFSSMLVHVTAAVAPRHAADISGTFTTSVQVAGTLGVAAFGSLYLSLLTHPGAAQASHAFGVVTVVFAFVALTASPMAYRATHATSKRVTSASGAAGKQPVGWDHGHGDQFARTAGAAGDRAGERI
jgi:predicted MFS family arabinose efflux permease